MAAMTTAIVGGCGGGSSSPPRAEGVYAGTLAGNDALGGEMNLVVLENDEYWLLDLYSPFLCGRDCAGAVAGGLFQGQGTSSNGTFTSSNVVNFQMSTTATGAATISTGTANASYIPSQSIGGNLNMSYGNLTFSGTPMAASRYAYDIPATTAAIAGNWSLSNSSDNNGTLTVDSDGKISGGAGVCSQFAGTIAPRPSGKNVYNVSITYIPYSTVCPSKGGVYTGIAISYMTSDGVTRRLLLAVLNGTRTSGEVFTGAR